MKPIDPSVRSQAVLDVPLNSHLGLVFEGCTDGVAHAYFDVKPHHIGFGSVHAGALYALMDAVGMLALLPTLKASQHAVTHDLHVSVMRPVPADTRCRMTGAVVRQGRTLAFMEVTARVNDAVVATARVTKSLTSH